MDDMHPVPAEILDEMAAYYRDRAPEYDAWFERRGNHDHGEAENGQWVAEIATAFAALDALDMTGDVLEFAGRTLCRGRSPRHGGGNRLSIHLWNRKPRAVLVALIGFAAKRNPRRIPP